MLRFLFLLALLPLFSFSQIKYEKTIEIAAKNNTFGRYLQEFGRNGILFRFRYANKEKTKRKETWHYILYNRNLELESEKSVTIPFKIIKAELSDSIRNYTLFTDKDKAGDYSFVTFDTQNSEITKINGVFPKKFYINDFRKMDVRDDVAYIEGLIKRKRIILAINWKTGEQKLIESAVSELGSKIKLDDFQLLCNKKGILLYYSDKSIKDKDSYVIKVDNDGSKTDLINLTQFTENRLINARANKLELNSILFSGEWTNKINDKRAFISFKKLRENSGIYFCKLNESKIEFLKFIKTSFIQAELRKNESLWQKVYGINDYRNYKIIIKPDGYILILEINEEIRYPSSRAPQFVCKGAFVSKFALDGDLIWSHTFGMKPLSKAQHGSNGGAEIWGISLKSRSDYFNYRKLRFISIDELSNYYLKLMFESEKKIFTKIFDENGNIIQEKETEKIIIFSNEDETIYPGNSKIVHWFNKYFIIILRKKSAYSISKISYN